jgi:hypothetical protein
MVAAVRGRGNGFVHLSTPRRFERALKIEEVMLRVLVRCGSPVGRRSGPDKDYRGFRVAAPTLINSVLNDMYSSSFLKRMNRAR